MQESGYPVINLTDTETGCRAEIYGFGGLLNAFRIPVKNGLFNVIDGFSSVENAIADITNGFKSTKLSPFVCRMNKGTYAFENKNYTIRKFFLGPHAIHGLLFDASFEVKNTESTNDHALVTLEYNYNGTDAGYPFSYSIVITWKLESGNKLSLSTTISNRDSTRIPIADGWHPYFSLGGSVDDCTLQFTSEMQLEYDDELLPTGKQFSDQRFINGTSLRGIELDNSFALDAGKAAACVLQNNALRITIEPDQNYPILQIYIPPHRNSIAIENLSGAPDNFNNGMGLLLLEPGNSKTFLTSYSVAAL